jgi:hypothetical protein
MDGLRDELFAREDEEAIILDEAHVVTDGESVFDRERSEKGLGCQSEASEAGSIGGRGAGRRGRIGKGRSAGQGRVRDRVGRDRQGD